MKRDASRRLRLLVFSASAPCCDARLAEAVLDRNLAVLCLLVLDLDGTFGLEEVALDASAALQSGVVAVEATAGLDVPWVMMRIVVVCNVQVSTAKASSGNISQQ
jgi:hypothetical protein